MKSSEKPEVQTSNNSYKSLDDEAIIIVEKPEEEQHKNPITRILASFSLHVGVSILGFLLINFVVCFLSLLVKVPIQAWHFWISVGLSVIFSFWLSFRLFSNTKIWLKLVFTLLSLLLVIVSFVGSLMVSQRFYDLSYDGQAYQQEAIIELKNGWNPIYERAPGYGAGGRHAIWLNAYPKAAWINSVSIYNVTNNIETGKLFNLWSLVGALFFAIAALLSIESLKKIWVIPIAIILVANPVSLYQITSYYIDGQLFSVMIMLLASFTLVFKSKNKKDIKTYLILMIMSATLLVNLKSAGLVYGVIFVFSFLAFIIVKYRQIFKKVFLSAIIACVAGVGILGFNPYLTNQYYNGSFLYPVFGRNSYDFKSENLPNNFRTKNTIEVLFSSPFLESDNARGNTDIGRFKTPFTINQVENIAFNGSNAKKGGFGPMFGGVIIISALILGLYGIFYFIQKRKFKDENANMGDLDKLSSDKTNFLVFLGVIGVVMFSIVLNSASTYARFVPQYWLIPMFIAVFALISKSRVLNVLAVCILCLLAFNSAFVLNANINYQLASTDKLKAKLEDIKSKSNKENPLILNFNNATSTRQRLQDLDIPFTEVKPLTCKSHWKYYIPENESDVCVKN